MNTSTGKDPLVSVIMPVYNGGAYIAEAIDSIRKQTYVNWELIVTDDGSTDSTPVIIKQKIAVEPRIRLITHTARTGQSKARNDAIGASRGTYIALLDSDDLALPERLETQVRYMESHPDIALAGSWVLTRSEQGSEHRPDELYRSETDPDIIAAGMLFNAMLINSSVMVRRKFLAENKLSYDESSPFLAEDYALWVKCAERGRVAVIPKPLAIYRKHDLSISAEKKTEHSKKTAGVQQEVLRTLGIVPTEEESLLHASVYAKKSAPLEMNEFVKNEQRWLTKIKEGNDSARRYPPHALSYTLEKIWYTICSQNLTGSTLKSFISHPFSNAARHMFLSTKLAIKYALPSQK